MIFYKKYKITLYLNSNNAVASGQAVNIVPDSTKIVFSGNEQSVCRIIRRT